MKGRESVRPTYAWKINNKQNFKVHAGFSWLRKRPVAGYCEHDHETYIP